MFKPLIFVVAMIPPAAIGSAGYATVLIPETTAAICGQLGVVAYWHATSAFSKQDALRSTLAEKEARTPNKLRPAIPEALIREARKWGRTAHGNAGPGNYDLGSAREGAILAAMGVYEDCLDGSLAP